MIAKEQRVAPEEAGRTLDLIEISIEKCLLGLFGYGPQKKIVRPAESVSAELEKAISANLTDGRLPCVKAWNIADTLHLSKMDVAAACEKLGMKISRCQLGAF